MYTTTRDNYQVLYTNNRLKTGSGEFVFWAAQDWAYVILPKHDVAEAEPMHCMLDTLMHTVRVVSAQSQHLRDRAELEASKRSAGMYLPEELCSYTLGCMEVAQRTEASATSSQLIDVSETSARLLHGGLPAGRQAMIKRLLPEWRRENSMNLPLLLRDPLTIVFETAAVVPEILRHHIMLIRALVPAALRPVISPQAGEYTRMLKALGIPAVSQLSTQEGLQNIKSFGGYIAGSQDAIDRLHLRSNSGTYAEAMIPPVLMQIIASTAGIMSIEGHTPNLANGSSPVPPPLCAPRPSPTGIAPTWLDIPPSLHDSSEGRSAASGVDARYLSRSLHKLGFIIFGGDDSPPMLLLLFNTGKMVEFSRLMLGRPTPIAVVVFSYPATSLSTARVHFCISAEHTKQDVDDLLHACDEIGDYPTSSTTGRARVKPLNRSPRVPSSSSTRSDHCPNP
ncbi:hypothetical protein BKA62DRAFT_676122 [Auriculariales sp. MPI-PUGE-AT-0066]|nr:hypothetical protein BKA62DRAFT_676122 [Auriculariales sp. MPI-PUGE-AT-0066]